MTKVNAGKRSLLPSRPSDVIYYMNEYFVEGTQRGVYIQIVPKYDKKKKKNSSSKKKKKN